MISRSLTCAGGIAAAIILVGCTGSAVPPSATASPPLEDCGASVLKSKVGQPVTGHTASDVRVGDAPVQSHGDVRVIGPNDAMIQNYSEARLNLDVDAARNLVRPWCG